MKICILENCGKPHSAKGYCAKHAYRYKKYGCPLTIKYVGKKRKYSSQKERFDNSYIINHESDCWEWVGAKASGYGCFTWDGKIIGAHRFSYEHHFNFDCHGFFVCHKCDNKICVNPSHLFVGLNIDNVNDMVQKGRQQRGAHHSQSKLSEQDVIFIKSELAKGTRQIALCVKYNVSRACISDIYKGKRWAHI